MTDDERITAEDDAPPSAQESLRLIHEQRAATERSIRPDLRAFYWPWGVAWLVGFGLLFLRHGPGNRVTVDMPPWLPLATLFTLMAGAMVITSIVSARAYRHVHGESATKGMLYGFSWALGFAGLSVTAARVSDYLPEAQIGLMWAGLSVGLVAALYLAGGAVWSDRNLARLGGWVGLVNIVGVIAGPGWHSLLISLAGGGGLLLAGAIAWPRQAWQS